MNFIRGSLGVDRHVIPGIMPGGQTRPVRLESWIWQADARQECLIEQSGADEVDRVLRRNPVSVAGFAFLVQILERDGCERPDSNRRRLPMSSARLC